MSYGHKSIDWKKDVTSYTTKNQPEAQKPAGKNNLIVEVLNALTHGVGVAVGILFLVLRIFDHVVIYLFIAGTFTPGIFLSWPRPSCNF